ncbi:YceI family protein [Niastella caeni]|uniref:YceI family protein n=1 Tax=Niastella caeni TaxID=2569763 RepID=A0A4S8H749_9BACT|nr:YceI family protein [Niastella caeni]THU30387.1 YceI family protein [Niastella caeni]
MKFVLASFLALFLFLNLSAQSITPLDSASQVTFKIKNLGFNTTGSFSGLAGTITFNPDNPDGCSFDVHIDASTVNTGVELRDKHLRSEDYFDVKNYPKIRFVSVKITGTKKNGTLFVSGKLTMRGITKDISFPFTWETIKDGYLFNGSFKLNRRDFKVGGGSTVSDNLTVLLKVVAKKV